MRLAFALSVVVVVLGACAPPAPRVPAEEPTAPGTLTALGYLEGCQIVRSVPLMDQAVLEAMTTWRYERDALPRPRDQHDLHCPRPYLALIRRLVANGISREAHQWTNANSA